MYEADLQAKQIMEQDKNLILAIKKFFGNKVYSKDHRLNRKFLAKKAFQDTENIKKLNQLVHPKVASSFQAWLAKNQCASYVIKEAAILFEANTYKQFDKIITVMAPEPLRIQRIRKRDPYRSVEDIKKITQQQWRNEKKAANSDFIIYNDGHTLLIDQVLRLHKTLLNMACCNIKGDKG